MVRLQLDHVLRCEPQRFWAGFFSPETIASFYTRAIGFTRFEILRQESDATSIERVADCHLPVVLSRQLQGLFRTGFHFVEEGVFERPSGTWQFRWIPATLPSRIAFHGSMRARGAEDEPGSCHRLVELEVTARVPALSHLLERAADRILRTTWDLSATRLNEWLAQGLWG